jgi:hypothetical protein
VSPILSLFLPLYLICLFFVLSPQTLHLCFVSIFSLYLFLSVCCPSYLLPPGYLLSVPTLLIQFYFSLLQSSNYFSFLLFSPTLSMTGSSFPSIFPLSFLLYFTALCLPFYLSFFPSTLFVSSLCFLLRLFTCVLSQCSPSISFCLCVAPLTYSLQVICSLFLPISSNLISPSCNLTITFLFFSFLPLYQ